MLLAPLLALLQAADPKPVETLPPLVPWNQHRLVSSLSPARDRLALATMQRDVHLVDLASKRIVQLTGKQERRIVSVVWSPDGSLLAVQIDDGSVALVDSATGVTKQRIPIQRVKQDWWHEDGKLAFVSGGTRVAIAVGNNVVEIWSVEAGQLIAKPTVKSGSIVSAMASNRAGDSLATGTDDGYVTVWGGPVLDRVISTCRVDSKYKCRYINALDFDPSGKLLAIGGGDCRARVWRFETTEPMRTFDRCKADWFLHAAVGSVQFSPDGSYLLTTPCDAIYDVCVWDAVTTKLVGVFDEYGGGDEMPIKAWFSSDGKRVVSSLALATGTRGADGQFAFKKPLDSEWHVHFCSDGDYAWAVIDHHLVVRKIPDEQPVLRVAVRER